MVGPTASLIATECLRIRDSQNLAEHSWPDRRSSPRAIVTGIDLPDRREYPPHACTRSGRTHATRPLCQICSLGLKKGHRADVCPPPEKTQCTRWGHEHPQEAHDCKIKCVLFGDAHPATLATCPARQRRNYSLSRRTLPPPHVQLTREEAAAWRQLQTNTFPSLLLRHTFYPTTYPDRFST
ncbi:hypothetical protein HPB48_018280 [Haemaphysalis longicornis]|uniref:Uncharacterized protein n=1 Tax=Haemaphysalis longicornis TaxID=44386 RepID=A0A9J6H2J4_HAELO|nr:hypothetical protein HPB48_018280 [Haemaphysalis longicornis]